MHVDVDSFFHRHGNSIYIIVTSSSSSSSRTDDAGGEMKE